MDVLLYVQHLLGIGHLRRAALLAKALDQNGFSVVLVSGGAPVAGLDRGGAGFVQLPPLRTRDASFSELLDQSGRPIDDAWKAARRARLLALYHALKPRALLIEMFPFGRRQMRFELLPLLEAAAASTPRPQVLCSLRDVLTRNRRPEKTAWMLDTFARHFDLALVHGDPDFLPLERSFPEAAGIAAKLRYTGYVVEVAPTLDSGTDGTGEAIVSTGGGAVAGPLIEAALAARALSPLAEAPWRFLIGPNMAEAAFRDLAARAGAEATLGDVIIERARPDFRSLLARADLSISQGGYNTVLEVLAAGVPAVVVPFAAGSESEQSLRARLLAARGALTLVEEAALTPASLATAIAAALARGRAGTGAGTAGLDLRGAQTTVDILRERLDIVAS
ncbi:MAG: glycosyl transferase [Proteobacteria bacterium]|nr:glycosyl transferase [Pseudomonadota bacterium]